MSDKAKCTRCNAVAETYNFEADATFWGFAVKEYATTITRQVRVIGTYFNRSTDHAPLINCDERMPLCSDCWGLFVGRFMQGRDVPALPGEEGR